MSRSWIGLLISLLYCTTLAAETGPHNLEDFLKTDQFRQIELSPDGAHYALTIPHEDRTLLRIVKRADMATTMGLDPGTNRHVVDLVWANDERLLFGVEEKIGLLDRPLSTGEIFATNADGSHQELLFGVRAEGTKIGSRIDKGKQEYGSAWVLDELPSDDRKVLVSVWPWARKAEPYSQVEEMDIYTGRRNRVVRAPVQRAQFLTDRAGQVRFAFGAGVDNNQQTWYRADNDADWEQLNDQSKTRRRMWPLGFSADEQTAYLRIEEDTGPDAIYAFDVASGERTLALQGDFADPYLYLRSPGGRTLVGATYLEGLPVMRYFDRKSADAILYRTLAMSFPGQIIRIASATRDGNTTLLHVYSDRNPGDFYLFDVAQKKAEFLVPAQKWIDPRRTAEMQPIKLQARDGLALHGYLTVPPGSEGKNLPLVLLPHGGPFYVADSWGYDNEVQLLAAHGYAVLQVNFRGSSLYGRAHAAAGLRQWGKAMQDDLTDATRWAIEQGIADPARICIYGHSYGGYAALMGAAKEPDLYQCAAGYVGVYDLPLLYREGDIQERRADRNLLEHNLGKDDLEAYSPARLAGQIKSPVFLAAGGKDERAPVAHTEAMERALKSAGVAVESLIYPNEGHGFYVEANKREFYTRLLAFFDKHIGAAAAGAD